MPPKEPNQSSKELPEKRKRADPTFLLETEEVSKLSVEEIAYLLLELRLHKIELEMQNEELRKIQLELEKSREEYSELYDFAPVGYFTLNDKGIITKANLTLAKQLGKDRNTLVNTPFSEYIRPESQYTYYLFLVRYLKEDIKVTMELRLKSKNSYFDALLESVKIKNRVDDTTVYRMTVTDVTKIKKAEAILKMKTNNLEHKVEKYSNELTMSENALEHLLKRNEKKKLEIEANVLSNAKQLILPFVQQMKKSGLNAEQRDILLSLESSLTKITSPVSRFLSSKFSDLTPKEIQISHLLLEGFSSKEIAKTLDCSTNTIEFHRKNLRKKMGLIGSKLSLKKFLTSLSE